MTSYISTKVRNGLLHESISTDYTPVISGIVYFYGIILESSRNVSETTPRTAARAGELVFQKAGHQRSWNRHILYEIFHVGRVNIAS